MKYDSLIMNYICCMLWYNGQYLLNRIADMMDITSEDIVNKNLYDYCHAEDLQKLNKAHTDRKSRR